MPGMQTLHSSTARFFPRSIAIFKVLSIAFFKSSSSFYFPPCHTGPTAWMTYLHFIFPPDVYPQDPVSTGPCSFTHYQDSLSSLSPPAPDIAPATPPPCQRLLFAAFVIIPSSFVIFPCLLTSFTPL